MACDGWITIKILLFLLTIVCLILKRVTDYDASRLFFLLEKLSYEWPLLSNITWDENGAAFVDITYGGFVIITAGLLVAAACGELRRRNVMESFFLVLGGLMFGAAGALILASIDQVPHHLVNNAAALGVISLITALLFFADFGLASKRRKRYKPPPKSPPVIRTNNSTQTHDPKTFIGPLFAKNNESPIHRFRHPNHTTPKWLGDAEVEPEIHPSAQGEQQMMSQLHPPPPVGFMHDTSPSRGFVMRTAQNWPKVDGKTTKTQQQQTQKQHTPMLVTRTKSNDSQTSQETLDMPNMDYEPHMVEITTETPRAVINTKVLHRWLKQNREGNNESNHLV